ncbi:hypothetical protein EIP86_011252 [Pleurotus ostreatoroseus]|nr:hypothetical protein EIP86_011252 [Pleurotus ostreatoroseus]
MGESVRDGSDSKHRQFMSLGMFIIDEFSYLDEDGQPTGRTLPEQIGGGGTLPPNEVGMIVDRGHDFPPYIQTALDQYGKQMWIYRDDFSRGTTRALNEYRGDIRGFRYLTPRVRITPKDLIGTDFDLPKMLHFICSPSRAAIILSEVRERSGWRPITIYEPIPPQSQDRCVPEELSALLEVLPSLSILSPNADEALSLLSILQPPSKSNVEEACQRFLDYGVGVNGEGAVIIRSGALGAYVATRAKGGQWIPAFWKEDQAHKVVDVTEQDGLPTFTLHEDKSREIVELWNGETPQSRLKKLMDTNVV